MPSAPLVQLPPRFLDDPGPVLAEQYARSGPIFQVKLPRGSVHIMIGPEANRFVMGANRHYFSHELGWKRIQRASEVFGRGLLFLDGPEHRARRQLLTPPFRIHQAPAAAPIVERVFDTLTASWETQPAVDVFEGFFRIAFAVAAEAFLGLTDPTTVDELREYFVNLEALGAIAIPEKQRLAREQPLRAGIRRIVQRQIDARRASPANDVLSLLAASLDDDAVHAEVNTLLLAGHITTASLTSWTLFLLLRHPHYLRNIQDPNVLDRVMMEAERLYPPLGHMPRVSVAPFTFHGYDVPRDSFVACSLVGGHRLPHCFADPDRFDPERFAPPREEHKRTPDAFLPFSGGPRLCLGIYFATTMVRTILTRLFHRYRVTLLEDRPVICRYRPMATPVNGLWVRVESLL